MFLNEPVIADDVTYAVVFVAYKDGVYGNAEV